MSAPWTFIERAVGLRLTACRIAVLALALIALRAYGII